MTTELEETNDNDAVTLNVACNLIAEYIIQFDEMQSLIDAQKATIKHLYKEVAFFEARDIKLHK